MEVTGDRRALLITAVLAVLLTALVSAPVVRDPMTRLFGAELVGRHHDPFTVMEQYRDGRVPSPYLQPATDFPGIYLARLTGAVAAYNWLLLITFPLSALLACAHARYLIGSTAGAVVAGLLFAFSPFHFAHAAYHVHIAQIQWIPLFFLMVWRALDGPTLARGTALAAVSVLVVASSFYLGFVVAVIAPVAVVVYWRRRARGRSGRLSLIVAIGGLAAASVVVMLAVWIAAPRVLSHPDLFGFPFAALEPHSARWWSYLVPPLDHPWLAPLAARMWAAHPIGEGILEQQVSLGWSVLVLAAIPVARWLLGRDRGSITPVLAALAAWAIYCSLPPVAEIGPFAVPTPSRILYAVAPVFRSYARFGVVASLMITTLAGAGVARLFMSGRFLPGALAVLLVGVSALEYWPPARSWRDVLPTKGHRLLAGSREARLLDCVTPTEGATSGVSWLAGHDVAFLVGPFADCGEPELAAKLAAFGFTHVLVRIGTDDAVWASRGEAPDNTRLTARFDDSWVFEVTAPNRGLFTTWLSGFYRREYLESDSWRWMGEAGSLSFVNAAHQPVAASLDLELESFAVERAVSLTLDRAPLARIIVDPSRRWYHVGPFAAPVGEHTIALAPHPGAQPPSSVGQPGDLRPLAVCLHRWRWRQSSKEALETAASER